MFFIQRAALYFARSTVVLMGKFPVADKALSLVWVCRKCKARNARGAERCRKCGYLTLRPKRARKKEVKGK